MTSHHPNSYHRRKSRISNLMWSHFNLWQKKWLNLVCRKTGSFPFYLVGVGTILKALVACLWPQRAPRQLSRRWPGQWKRNGFFVRCEVGTSEPCDSDWNLMMCFMLLCIMMWFWVLTNRIWTQKKSSVPCNLFGWFWWEASLGSGGFEISSHRHHPGYKT